MEAPRTIIGTMFEAEYSLDDQRIVQIQFKVREEKIPLKKEVIGAIRAVFPDLLVGDDELVASVHQSLESEVDLWNWMMVKLEAIEVSFDKHQEDYHKLD